MNTEGNKKAELLIGEGIRQIKAGFRSAPDPYLFDRISVVLNQSGENQTPLDSSVQKSNPRFNKPAIKLGWSLTAAAAAIFAGVLVGNLFLSGNYTAEKEAYRQEITMQSDDISGLSAELINYYNEDNQ